MPTVSSGGKLVVIAVTISDIAGRATFLKLGASFVAVSAWGLRGLVVKGFLPKLKKGLLGVVSDTRETGW